MTVARLTNVAGWDAMLGHVRSFLNAAGWTIHIDLEAGSEGPAAGGRDFAASKGDCLIGLRSTTSGAGANRLYLFDGIPPYVSRVDVDLLPGNSGPRISAAEYAAAGQVTRGTNPQIAGPFPTAHLFTDAAGNYCHVAVEIAAGRYRHFMFGNLRKFGTWTGGAYYCMQYWEQGTSEIDVSNATHHVTPFDGSFGWGDSFQSTFHYEDGSGVKWRAPGESTLNGVVRKRGVGSGRGGFGTMFRSLTESQFSGLVALQPVTLWSLKLTDVPVTTRCVGQIRDCAEVNMRNLAPGASYFIGADEWIVFPFASKGDPTIRLDVENSGNYGIAYLVRP